MPRQARDKTECQKTHHHAKIGRWRFIHADDFAKMVKALKPPLYFPMDFVAKKLKMNYGVLSRVLSVVPLVRVKEVRARENTEAF